MHFIGLKVSDVLRE